MYKLKRSIIVIISLVLALPLQAQEDERFFKAAGTPVNPRVKASWNKYYTYTGIQDLCKRLAEAYPDLVKIESAGKSYEGRDLITMIITNHKNQNPDHKSGYYIDGNIHSNEIQGTEMALYAGWYLAEMYDENEFIRELLDDKVFYIIPTINPDARENYMREPNTSSSPRSGMVPRDDDRDGLVDEDGFDDINNDGVISMMRRKDPFGQYKEDPSDPRQMVRVEEGETGEYEMLGYEGIDNDGDGEVNEDRQGYYDPNRDWGYNWEPDYVQRGADKYPFSFPENQAVRDFALKHKNIAGAQSYHNSGGMILRGPSIEGGGSEVYSREDELVINAIGEMGETIIPGYRFLTIWKDMYTVYGGEVDWWYGFMGVYVYSNELWSRHLMFHDDSRDSYKFDKLLLFEDAFIPWEEYDHPVYGKVEIGGFDKNFGRNHPGFLLESDAHRNSAFCFYHAYQTPKLVVRDIEVEELQGSLKQVTATVANQRLMPTHSGQNLKYKIDPPDYVYLDGGEVITGMIVLDEDRDICNEQVRNPQRLEVENIPGNSSVTVRWIVKGGNKYTVRVESVKGGRTEKSTE
ncbi:MAG: M14 family metallopeptidase [Bacteroidota bacterium]|nr:M14 family metallopeptidase [Bacteroidota bacterium]